MDRSAKELIAAVVAIMSVLIAGLAWIDDGMNDRFDLIDQRFEITDRANSEAHARIENSIRDLRADFRAIVPRAAAERKPAGSPTP